MAQRASVVRGVVSDELGAVVVGGTVSLTGATTLTTVTDELGAYRFNGIPAGRYSLTIAQPGFAMFQTSVALSDGQSRTINVTLRIA
ncbi:MAG TPA: carboxypeptidase-like regulatory domain-containing protein, partial [Pyrinomonadaceae bacterium]